MARSPRTALEQVGTSHHLPLNFFLINVLGSFFIGMIMALSAEWGVLANQWRLFWGVGVLGGFTTFSTFMLGVHTLWQDTKGLAVLYLTGTLIAGLAAAFGGLVVIREVARMAASRTQLVEIEDEA
ncbi:fluoride efflux transporter FluC [Sulfobacillus thermosulfidooxidans]|uniref:fluoride efflux transporter FluC n=1 Tax=Sulfobacillus thermosulfidooxidans TaxID=28034 RepID=UPI0002E0A688|nr:CrcB family protein [Sulfobacillus thermosulfidooxidans]